LLHNTSEKIKVRVEFKKDINVSDLPSSGDTSIVFKFIGDYKQADEKFNNALLDAKYANISNTYANAFGVSAGTLGNMIQISTLWTYDQFINGMNTPLKLYVEGSPKLTI
jgi:hypothetical protein